MRIWIILFIYTTLTSEQKFWSLHYEKPYILFWYLKLLAILKLFLVPWWFNIAGVPSRFDIAGVNCIYYLLSNLIRDLPKILEVKRVKLRELSFKCWSSVLVFGVYKFKPPPLLYPSKLPTICSNDWVI